MQRVALISFFVILASVSLSSRVSSGERQAARKNSLDPDSEKDQTHSINRKKTIQPRYTEITYTHHLLPSNTVITVRQRTNHSSEKIIYSGHTKKCSDDFELDLEDPESMFMQCQELWRQVHNPSKKSCSIL